MSEANNEWKEKGGADLYTQIRSPKFSLVYPDMIERLRAQKPLKLLDYGCGSGAFLKEFSAALGIEQTGYDIDPEMCRIARETCSVLPQTAILNDLQGLKEASFDAITKTAVWMVWKTHGECVENLKAIRRLLSREGRLYAAITHPCFRDRAFSGNVLHLDMNHYFDPGYPYQAEIKDATKTMSLTNYHWSLSEISGQLKESGFVLDEIHEYPDVVQPAQGSPWMLLTARPQ